MIINKVLSVLILLTVIAYTPNASASDNSYIQNRYGSPLNLIESGVQTQRIPAGTLITLRLETPINSLTSKSGDPINSTIIENVKVGKKIVLPVGSLARGFVGTVKGHTYLSKPGMLSMTFDHVVTPIGKQLPIIVQTTNLNADKNDVIKAQGGYLRAVNEQYEKGVDILFASTTWGYKAGKSYLGGYPAFVTTPLCAIAGSAVGSSSFAFNSFMALFKKGDNVILNPGQDIKVRVVEDIDLVLN